ncbi:GyrI-like domain-containing protein [Joostella sp.]|uniref:GyrI-like domain-containing protein n=1 Tax=Joostella sp. TaxID=2231138 RepID=UPI003A8E8C28
MEHRIETIDKIVLVGKYLEMSIAENKTGTLWGSFMPEAFKIKNRVGADYFSVEEYDEDYFKEFVPTKNFKKWATVRVSIAEEVPQEFATLIVPKGKYAVFTYKGKSSEAFKAYQYIFGEWLSSTKNVLDHRPHFAIMGAKYKNDDPTSEEEIWIPIQ